MKKKLCFLVIIFSISISLVKSVSAQVVDVSPTPNLATSVSPTSTSVDSTPTPSLVVTPTDIPLVTPTPTQTISPTSIPSVTPVATNSPSIPSPTTIPVIQNTNSISRTPSSTSVPPLPFISPIATKTATIAAFLKDAPIIKQIRNVVTFPADFVTHSLSKGFYLSGELSKTSTYVLLFIALIFLLIGIGLLKPGILTVIYMKIIRWKNNYAFRKGHTMVGV